MGGATALSLALDRPDLVFGLVLISPSLGGWDWSDEWNTYWDRIVAAACGGDMAYAKQLWAAHPMFAASLETPGVADAFHAAVERFAGRQWITDPKSPSPPDVERLHGLQPPTLLLSGGRDAPDLQLIADIIETAAPDVRRIHAPEAGHLLHQENPDECAAQIAAFLDSVSPGA